MELKYGFTNSLINSSWYKNWYMTQNMEFIKTGLYN